MMHSSAANIWDFGNSLQKICQGQHLGKNKNVRYQWIQSCEKKKYLSHKVHHCKYSNATFMHIKNIWGEYSI